MSVRAATEEETVVSASVSIGGAMGAAGNPEVPVVVTLTPPLGTQRNPVDICCVVDVSGSMSAEATVQSEAGSTTAHGLSVLDIVSHAMKTIIRNLQAEDRIGLVSYSTNGTVVSPLVAMDEAGRNNVEGKLGTLVPQGMTNLWDGLSKGMAVLADGHEPGRLQHVMVFTDGMPNINPPRGILPMLRRMKDKAAGKLPVTISTFGFGYELDSELLAEMAVLGCGSYAFIPDAGFVGTVFVNAMTNLLTTFASHVTLTLEPVGGAEIECDVVPGGYPATKTGGSVKVSLGTMQFGQERDVLLSMKMPRDLTGQPLLKAKLEYTTRMGEARVVDVDLEGGPVRKEITDVQFALLFFADLLRDGIRKCKMTSAGKATGKTMPLAEVQQALSDGSARIAALPVASTEAVQALLEDLQGQVAEAFSREDWYTKWGLHYLQSLLCAHLNQICNNFKDPGVQVYGGELFGELRDAADDIFCTLPAPTPGRRAPALATGTAPPRAVSRPAAPVSMSTYYDRYSGCIDGACTVRLADGGGRLLAEVQKGDVLAQPGGGSAEVACVVRTLAPGGKFLLVELGGLRVTPYHPVFVDGAWRFPADLAAAEERPCEAVYSLVLREEGAGALLVGEEAVPCASLGHNLQEGAAKHPFFGSRKSVEDLAKFPGFDMGLVDLGPGCARRDPLSGLVCGYEPAA